MDWSGVSLDSGLMASASMHHSDMKALLVEQKPMRFPFPVSPQADELTRVVSRIGKQVERVKENNDAIITSFTNQSM